MCTPRLRLREGPSARLTTSRTDVVTIKFHLILLLRCAKFDDPAGSGDILQYECVAKAGTNPVKGEWRDLAETGQDVHDEAALSAGRLVEPSCDCEALTLDRESFSQEGLLIQCTKGSVDEATPSIPAPNHCLLLCDYYSVMHIFTDWKPDQDDVEVGEQGWYYRLAGDPDDGMHNNEIDDVANTVRCWA